MWMRIFQTRGNYKVYFPQRDRQAGITLLETLVVLVIIAVLAGSVIQSASSVSARRDIETLTILAARVTLLSDLALASGSDLVLHVDTTPWRVEGDIVRDANLSRSATGWLSETSAGAFVVRNSDGDEETSVHFYAKPRPQLLFFEPQSGNAVGPRVAYDGLTAVVTTGDNDV